MTGPLPYATPAAFGAALTDRLGHLADTRGGSLAQLRRLFAYDRLLARLFATDPDGWILKGWRIDDRPTAPGAPHR